MKKNARHIYVYPVSRKKKNGRSIGLALLVTAALLCFVVPTGGDKAVFVEADKPETTAISQSVAQPLPAPADRVAVATIQPQIVEKQAEEEQLLLAAVGESFSRFKDLPFFVPAPAQLAPLPEESPISPADDASFLGEDYSDLSNFAPEDADTAEEPKVWPENERYTVVKAQDGSEVFRSNVKKGDTAGTILNDWLDANAVANLITTVKPVYSLTSIREGQPFTITRSASGHFVSFEYEVDLQKYLKVTADNAKFQAALENISYETRLVTLHGKIASSLFEAVSDTGEGANLAVQLADVFSCEVNFIKEIRQGDSFSVLVEKRYRDGNFKGYGNMLAARFTNKDKTYEAFLFPNADGRLRHFTAKGEGLQKTLLKAPLAFTRVSSKYSMARKHPVFRDVRAHQGIDYAAPTGTPIKAVGDGTVTRAGWGGGYGNMVVIKHDNGLESQYAHMSGFAKGAKKGARVSQGQVIGYVGATGTATGPHLDFRLKQNGKFVNPDKLIVPRTGAVDKKFMARFQETVRLASGYMDKNASEIAEYSPEKWPALSMR